MHTNRYPYQIPPLPYAYDALEPVIDRETMQLHHGSHLLTHVERLNALLIRQPVYQKWTLEQLLCWNTSLPLPMQSAARTHGGGLYNHQLYFELMTPGGPIAPVGELSLAIRDEFGSCDRFRQAFLNRAVHQPGAGYTCLALSAAGRLQIMTTQNQDTVLPHRCIPIILADTWEHAYYLRYRNRREAHLEAWWSLLNWETADDRYRAGISRLRDA